MTRAGSFSLASPGRGGLLAVAVAAVAWGGCGGDGPSQPEWNPNEAVRAVELVGNLPETVLPGDVVEVVVRALGGTGLDPVEGATVRFAPAPGHGTASPASASTDGQGLARTRWTVGTTGGTQTMTASVAAVSASVAVRVLTPEERVRRVEVHSGDGQSAAPGARLPQPVVVRARDAAGAPVEGAAVRFAPAAGHGSADPASAETDSQGLARTEWTLGIGEGAQTMTASVASVSTDVGARVLTPDERVRAVQVRSGDGQSAAPGAQLPEPVVVRALDADGAPVEGATVRFAPVPGHGWADPASAETDSEGLARTEWTLGTGEGAQKMTASVASVTTDVGARGLTPDERVQTIQVRSGDGQSAAPGARLPRPVVIRALDADGAPVEGATVRFAPAQGHGSVSPTSAETDSQGLARTEWTLGTAEAMQTMTASVASVSVSVTARVLTPDERVRAVQVHSGNGQSAAPGARLPRPVVVRVLDADGAPVEGVTVRFAPAQGHGSADPASAETDGQGLARTQWTLGSREGTQTMTVLVASVSVSVTARVLTPEERVGTIQVQSGNGQTAPPGARLPRSVVVRALDGDGAPVEGATIQFAPAQGHGSASPASAETDGQGLARTEWTLGTVWGKQQLRARVQGSSVAVLVEAVSCCRQPDLLVSSVDSTEITLVAGGGRKLVTFTILNAGEAAADATTATVLLSPDSTITTDDGAIGDTLAVPGLAASESTEFGLAFNVTAGVAPQVVYIGLCVAPVPDESDTSNNCSGASSTVRLSIVSSAAAGAKGGSGVLPARGLVVTPLRKGEP